MNSKFVMALTTKFVAITGSWRLIAALIFSAGYYSAPIFLYFARQQIFAVPHCTAFFDPYRSYFSRLKVTSLEQKEASFVLK